MTRRVDDLKARKAKCDADLATILNKIKDLTATSNDLKQKKQKIEDEIRTLRDKVNEDKNQADRIPA